MYTNNPHLPRLRMQAVRLVKQSGWSTRRVARYTGFSQSAIVKWCARDRENGYRPIATLSARPKGHPRALAKEVVEKIVSTRSKKGRCAEVVHQELLNAGVVVSLSSVKRTLERQGLTKKRSPWKRYHDPVQRPAVAFPGDLVMVDTIHLMMTPKRRIYVYTLIDVYSRWTYAWAVERISARKSVEFVKRAQALATFSFQCVQSDHGSEFSTHFTERIRIIHRHSRVGRPNDNSFIERFNRTVQEECLDRVPVTVKRLNMALRKYLPYYNDERLHLGIKLKTPSQLIPRY
jgi:transposase InsO family protein